MFLRKKLYQSLGSEQYISFLQSDELEFIEKDTLVESTLDMQVFLERTIFRFDHKQTLNNFFEILMTTKKLHRKEFLINLKLKCMM